MFKLLDKAGTKESLLALGLGAVLALTTNFAYAEKFGFGDTATQNQISGWDIDIRPDGKGLPDGKGTVAAGEGLYEERCSSCHGLFGEGEGRWPVLAGGEGTLKEERPTKTVGSYWPYASTLYDYIRRAMPFTAPRSLSDQQVYDITAYVLYLNEIVEDDFVLTKDSLATIEMPNKDNFFVDPRPASSHDAQMEQEQHKEKIRQATLKGETVQVATHSKAAVALSEMAMAGKDIYQGACKVCHGSGLTGSPKFGDVEAWSARIPKGMPILIQHAITGFTGDTGVMPPKGGRVDLSDKQVENAVAYMVESSQ